MVSSGVRRVARGFVLTSVVLVFLAALVPMVLFAWIDYSNESEGSERAEYGVLASYDTSLECIVDGLGALGADAYLRQTKETVEGCVSLRALRDPSAGVTGQTETYLIDYAISGDEFTGELFTYGRYSGPDEFFNASGSSSMCWRLVADARAHAVVRIGEADCVGAAAEAIGERGEVTVPDLRASGTASTDSLESPATGEVEWVVSAGTPISAGDVVAVIGGHDVVAYAAAEPLANDFPAGTAVSPGGSNDAVLATQTYLASLGYSVGPLDGELGGRTRHGMAAFNRDHGLSGDVLSADSLAWMGEVPVDAVDVRVAVGEIFEGGQILRVERGWGVMIEVP
ncbi:peptidoglycan-binding protein [Demequina sp. NBRC 110054]|uniref:peptidoglycan-binding domain-containing protein n=1 Tax=Demequina sp. NBRC 110054 TaxID=1570343 RepID=UPI000A05149F|nr:peptidoglycan-binding domain-containing protein [Demequina sp. NBRC 110054]